MRRLISGSWLGAAFDAEQLPSSPAERPTARVRRRWRAARVFQSETQKALAQVGLKFVEWLLLESLAELNVERLDAVSQVEVAERAGLPVTVVSNWMALLDEEGLVSRGPDMDGRAYRIIVTELGRQTLALCNERLEASLLTV